MDKLPPLDFQSFLAQPMRDYLDYLAHLGYATVGPAHNLRRLDRFWVQHQVRSLHELPAHWLLQLQEENPQLRTSTLRYLRRTFQGLCRYLVRQGWIEKNPLADYPLPLPQPYRPYVFSPQELRLLFDFLKGRSRQASDPVRFYRGLSDYTFYHLLYACGLRVSEAIHLTGEDYSPPEATLWIRPSKFGKDRLLPIGRRVHLNLTNLLAVRRRLFPGPGPAPLFLLLPEGRPYTRRRASDYFRACLKRLGIYRQRRYEQGVLYGTPHLHELRRTFAVHRLLAWYRQGADVDAKLPLLATYMGHAHFGYTKTYLPLTQELLREARERFARRFDRLDWVKDDPLLR